MLKTFLGGEGCQCDFCDSWRQRGKKERAEVSREEAVGQGFRGEELVGNTDEFI